MVSGSGLADSVEKFGPCGTMAPVFGLAAEVNADAEEEDDAGEVGFGFWDGYDFGAAARESTDFKSIADKATSVAAVEADIGEVGRKGGVVSKDKAAGVLIVVDWIVILGESALVPDGQVGAGCPGTDAAEAEDAGEPGEVDDGVPAEGELPDILAEVAAHGQGGRRRG